MELWKPKDMADGGIQRTEGDQGQANGDDALNSCEYTVSKLET